MWATYLQGGVPGAEGEGGYPPPPFDKAEGVRKCAEEGERGKECVCMYMCVYSCQPLEMQFSPLVALSLEKKSLHKYSVSACSKCLLKLYAVYTE